MAHIENIPFEELNVGDSDTLTHTVTAEDLLLFAKVSGDTNPVHLDENYAASTRFAGRIAHGAFTGSLISCALATKLPGPGCIYLSQQTRFKRPVKIDDTVTVHLEITAIDLERKRITVTTNVTNQSGKTVVEGSAELMPAVEKISVEEYPLPEITIGQ